jgi:hypothetical protein
VRSAEGVPLLVEVESVTPRPDGGFALVAAIKRPRSLRGHVFVATTDASGVIHHAGHSTQ